MIRTPHDGSRRRFFRAFAGDIAAATVQAFGLVSSLRTEAAEGVGRYLSDPPPVAVAEAATATRLAADGSGCLLPAFRDAGSAILVVDQKALPDRFAEVSIETAADAARIIGESLVYGSAVSGQLAALGLALTAMRSSDATAAVLHGLLSGSANALLSARPTDRSVRTAVARIMGRYEALAQNASTPEIAAALREEAAAIVDEAADDHARLAEYGCGELSGLRGATPAPGVTPAPRATPAPEATPAPGATVGGATLDILTHGATGPLATGRVGSALGMIHAAHRSHGDVHVWIDETRPGLEGARLTAWELASAGVPHTLVPDAAAGHLIATGRVDAVVVGAYVVAANGDVLNTVGTYPLAVLAARHSVPFYVCASHSSIDRTAADGANVPHEDGGPGEVQSVRGVRVAPPGTMAVDPRADVTPAELITAIVTGDGVLRPPFAEALKAVGQ